MFGVANTCIGECNMPEHLRSSNFSTPCRCLGVRGGTQAKVKKIKTMWSMDGRFRRYITNFLFHHQAMVDDIHLFFDESTFLS